MTAESAQVVLGHKGFIPTLSPGECASVLLGGSNDFFSKLKDTTCKGTITFKNAAGGTRSTEFVASAEHERNALVHDEEEPKTLYQLQRLPEALGRALGRASENPPNRRAPGNEGARRR